MPYQKEPTLICLGETKQAALYFDRIIPVSYCFQCFHEDPEEETQYEDYVRIICSLTGLDEAHGNAWLLAVNRELRDLMDLQMARYFGEKLRRTIHGIGKNGKEYELLKRLFKEKKIHDPKIMYERLGIMYIENVIAYGNKDFQSYIKKFTSLRTEPTVLPPSLAPPKKDKRFTVLLAPSSFQFSEADEEDVTLTIANLPLVNTNKATWNQILKFRKDEEAKRKLRNLRLFLHKNYEGKSRSFIEDDLNRLLEDYANTCKNWGFDSIISYISTVLDSKSLLTTIAATAGVALFGTPIASIATGVAGVAIEIGKIALTVARRKHDFHSLKRDHDLAYIIEAKERLENN